MKQIIHIYGASGSGTSTIGKKICDELGYRFMDTDDYFWMPTNPKFTTKREKNDRLCLMKEDIKVSENVVISGSLVDWGDELIPQFTLVIRVVTDTDIRIERLHKREYQRFGSRIEAGGDMFDNHKEFIEWAKEYDTGSIDMRSKAKHDYWQQLLSCHQVIIDGAKDLDENFDVIKRAIVFIQILEKVKMSIMDIFDGDSSGHDYWHSIRVFRNACKISNAYETDWEVVALAALLHDTDDCKLFETKNYENARKIMWDCNIDDEKQESVINIIKTVSFKGEDSIVSQTIEGKIVQDADRLDAIGAIGIARTFAFGGSRGRKMYEPNQGPSAHLMEAEYKSNEGTTINHFYEKLFLLKDMLNTDCAKSIANGRDKFMHQFIEEFYGEWNGKY